MLVASPFFLVYPFIHWNRHFGALDQRLPMIQWSSCGSWSMTPFASMSKSSHNSSVLVVSWEPGITIHGGHHKRLTGLTPGLSALSETLRCIIVWVNSRNANAVFILGISQSDTYIKQSTNKFKWQPEFKTQKEGKVANTRLWTTPKTNMDPPTHNFLELHGRWYIYIYI